MKDMELLLCAAGLLNTASLTNNTGRRLLMRLETARKNNLPYVKKKIKIMNLPYVSPAKRGCWHTEGGDVDYRLLIIMIGQQHDTATTILAQ